MRADDIADDRAVVADGESHPALSMRAPSGAVRGVVVVLHGGAETSRKPVRRYAAPGLRMTPFARMLWITGRREGVAVWRVRYRYRGWNGAAADAAADVGYALAAVRATHGEAPVVLVGHSMGARAALWTAGDPLVRGVAALAPWTPPGDPVRQLAGRVVLLAHGLEDTVTAPADSYAYALRAKRITSTTCRFELPGERHAMLRRAGDWHRLATGFALGVLGARELPTHVADALAAPAPDGLRATLTRGAR